MDEKYSLDNLFRVKARAEVELRGTKRTFYLRTISESADDFRQNHAIASARKTGRELKDPASLAWVEYLGDIDDLKREDLIEAAAALKEGEFRQAAQLEVHAENDPEPPDHPTVADIVEVEEQREEIEQEVETERKKYAEEQLKSWRESLAAETDEALREMLRESRRQAAMNISFTRGHRAATLFQAVYSDKKYEHRLFSCVQEVYEADPGLLRALTVEYNNLDVWSEQPDALKNLPSDPPPSK